MHNAQNEIKYLMYNESLKINRWEVVGGHTMFIKVTMSHDANNVKTPPC